MLNQIFDKYDPKNNLHKDAPTVTWGEYNLAIEVERLQGQISDLKQRCDMLESRADNQRALIGRIVEEAIKQDRVTKNDL